MVDNGFSVAATAGFHLIEAKQRFYIASWGKTSLMALRAVDALELAGADPAWVILVLVLFFGDPPCREFWQPCN